MLKKPIYAFLVAAFVPLSLFASNINEARFREILLPISILWAITLILLALGTLLTRNIHRAAIIVTLLVFGFLTSAHWVAAFWIFWPMFSNKYPQGNPEMIISIATVLVVALGYWIGSRMKDPAVWTPRINRFAIAIFLYTSALVGYRMVQAHLAKAAIATQTTALFPASRPSDLPADRPDIYLIILDAHGRSDTLKQLYNYDNTPFLNHLRDRGFYIASDSTGNYCYTDLAVSALLNSRYINEFANSIDLSFTPLHPLLRHSAVVSTLKSLGYTWVSFQTQKQNLCFPQDADVYYAPPGITGLTEFQQQLIDNTALNYLGGDKVRAWINSRSLDAYHAIRQTVLYELNATPKAAKLPGPKFVFVHLLCPHIPFVFRADGSDPMDRGYGALSDPGIAGNFTGQVYRDWYQQQATFIDNQVQNMVDQILANSAKPPVILLIGDHGPRSGIVWRDPNNTDLHECMANLTAVLLPGKNAAGLYPSITPVNLFRVVFNDYFNAKLPMLDDHAYFSTATVYTFQDVTKRVHLQADNSAVARTVSVSQNTLNPN